MQSGAARYLCIVQQFSGSGAVFLIFRIESEKGYQPAGISTWQPIREHDSGIVTVNEKVHPTSPEITRRLRPLQTPESQGVSS
jgi:hypothetical protein